MKTEKGTTEDNQIIADEFNSYFVEKIVTLKSNIDRNYVEDPLSKLTEKQKKSNLKFSLKVVQAKILAKAIKMKEQQGP